MPSSDLYDSLCERLEGRKYSNYFACYCIFDQHATPALLVFEDGMYKCLSCGKIGNHKGLDRKLGSHFRPKQNNTVSHVLPAWKKWEQEYGDLEGIVDAAHRCLKRNPTFQTYLKRRKIYDFVEEGNLGYLDGWCVFPVFSSNNIIVDLLVRSTYSKNNTRYVVSPIMVDSHSSLYVPSWNKFNQAQVVYVVYGIIDAISLHLAGLPVVTGVTGKSLNAELLLPLRKRFVIVPDDGEETEAYRLANKLGWRAKVKQIRYEENCKDPDDLRRKFGNEYLLQTLTA